MKQTLLVAMTLGVLAGYSAAAPRQVKHFTPGPQGTVLLFVASGCPCTDAHREMVKNILTQIDGKGITFYCVFSNEGETRDRAEHFFRQLGWDLPYVLDSPGRLADRFDATHTPQAFLLDPLQQVVFRGPIDDSNRNLGRVTQPYLRNALKDVLEGRPVQVASVQPTGCWIVTRNGAKAHSGS